VSTIGEVFPHDDPVACFVVAMSMAAHDIETAILHAAEANDADNPSFGYYVRLATGHTFDALDALSIWSQQLREVRDFLERLPQTGKERLRRARRAMQQIGGKNLEKARNRTFHYPCPHPKYAPKDTGTELATVLKQMQRDEAHLVVTGLKDESGALGRKPRVYFPFADDAASRLAFGAFGDTREELEEKFGEARDGGIAFVHFHQYLFAHYQQEQKLDFGEPKPR
jgi:hypothetical protein